MENQQPEALVLARLFERCVIAFGETETSSRAIAAKELRRLHARVQELEAMLDAVGAGGVSAQRVTQGKDHFAQDRKMVSAPVLPEPEAYLFQHEDTGQTMFVEAQQVEWGFEANNPRLQKISGVYTEEQVRELLAQAQAATNAATVLPDGSAFAVYNYPLPKDHWLYAPREYEQGAEEPKELAAPILTHTSREQVVSAVRYAVRAATDCGKETDFDPDALVQNAVYALCGPFSQLQPQADALDAERWRFIKRKLCLTGNGDGTCAMQALNLLARILGWPDVGELAMAQFLDTAIDAAIAAAKENK